MRKGVFIIESNKLKEEKDDRFEGEILKEMLFLMGVKVKYFYIRTRLELEKIIDEFYESNYSNLHIACHADEKGIALTFEDVELEEIERFFNKRLNGRRLFLSACSIGNGDIEEAFRGIGFESISAFDHDINFNNAAAFWVAFYHLLFKKDNVNNRLIKNIFKDIAPIFDCYPNYFILDRDNNYKLDFRLE